MFSLGLTPLIFLFWVLICILHFWSLLRFLSTFHLYASACSFHNRFWLPFASTSLALLHNHFWSSGVLRQWQMKFAVPFFQNMTHELWLLCDMSGAWIKACHHPSSIPSLSSFVGSIKAQCHLEFVACVMSPSGANSLENCSQVSSAQLKNAISAPQRWGRLGAYHRTA